MTSTARLRTLAAVAVDHDAIDLSELANHVEAAKGDVNLAITSWSNSDGQSTTSTGPARSLVLLNRLLDVTGDNVDLVKAIRKEQPLAEDLRQVALKFGKTDLERLLHETDITSPAADQAALHQTEKRTETATTIRRKLYQAERTAVVQRMVKDQEIALPGGSAQSIQTILDEDPTFSLQTTPVSARLSSSTAFKNISDDDKPTVEKDFKSLQRTLALAPVPEAIPVLLNQGLSTALQISNIPEDTFIRVYGSSFGDTTVAQSLHRHATASRARNEHFLINTLETVRGSGLRVIDGGRGQEQTQLRSASFDAVASHMHTQVNLEQLFGSLDYCECNECCSVYSAASYFVELLEFLRHSNLNPDASHTGDPSLKGTQLEQLLLRRPDLQCIQLTCENTNTLIPYIDLALEVMESYVVHAPIITAYNVKGETSAELLCSPQHTNSEAYALLRDAVYPLALPYHLPIDTLRVFLGFLRSSYADVLRVFQPDFLRLGPASQTAAQRASDAEFNLITQEEYVILTHEGFTPPVSTSPTCPVSCTCDRCTASSTKYNTKIRLRHPWEYFGYATSAELLDDSANPKTGLTWVKAQFLPRTGILYTDLVDLLTTAYVNPAMPMGKPLTIMLQLRFSYRFLSFLVRKQYRDKKRRFAWLVKFLSFAQPLIPLIEWAKSKDDPCAEISGDTTHSCSCVCSCEDGSQWKTWVYDWFERVGSIIVLESGEGPRLPIRGQVWAEPRYSLSTVSSPTPDTSVKSQATSKWVFVGDLSDDGGIVKAGQAVGFVTVEGKVVDIQTGKDLTESYSGLQLSIYAADPTANPDTEQLGYVGTRENVLIYYDTLHDHRATAARYSPAQDTCDIEQVRIMHLDGSAVQPDEYERMLRITRLARKMGWTVQDTDAAISGLSKGDTATKTNPTPADSGSQAQCDSSSDSEDEDDSDSTPVSSPDITPSLIHQLVAVKKLLDATGLPLTTLLTFWTDMPIHGDQSLYSQTFLTHNLVKLDPVFQADADGNYLTADDKISDHLPVLMAALRLTADDIAQIHTTRSVPDKLTLSNVSELFRIARLFRFLGVKINLLPDILAVFGDPFADADATLALVETWQSISDSGFTFPQLNYILRGVDNVFSPLGPSIPSVLRLTKTIYDGLVDIDKQHPDIVQADLDNGVVVLNTAIPAVLALVYESSLAGKIAAFLQGQYVFTTNAPAGLTLTGTVPAKAKYINQTQTDPPTSQLQVTGILTADEAAEVTALSPHPGWAPAVARIQKQATTFYNSYLAGLLPADGPSVILQGDTPDTPVTKGMYFLQYFIPFLRKTLATQLVQTTVADSVGLDVKLVSYLLGILQSYAGRTALEELLAVRATGEGDSTGWSGFLIPQSTDKYVFVVISDAQPAALVFNGQPVPFPHQGEDPSNVWSSDPVSMVAGTLYSVQLAGFTPNQLAWSTQTSPVSAVPTSSLLPGLSSNAVQGVLETLAKVALLVQGFSLSLDEIVYLHDHGPDFAADGLPLQFDRMTLGTWNRLLSYTTLRDELPKQPTRLIDLFAWASLPTSTAADASTQIAKVTLWDADKVKQLLDGYTANDLSNLRNERVLVELHSALDIITKTHLDIALLFSWAKPLSLSDRSYKHLETYAESMKNALRARYDADTWEIAAKPLFDTLRKDQRDGLVAYLLVEPSLVATGAITDADSLFEYFLIDCQMSACLETSRIKQAIATVQLYVQRCLLGLEDEVGTQPADLISRERWDWMKRYRVWEANRQVYLYPENWIVPSLRDDKSPFFVDFESALQQKDVSLDNAAESLKEYIYNVAYVANMKVYGLFVLQDSTQGGTYGVNIVARRMNAPYDWYSREYSSTGFWTPWVKMPLDIPNYDVDDTDGNSLGSGSYICPVIWHGQPIVFFLQMIQKQIPPATDRSKTMWTALNTDDADQAKPRPLWEIRLGFSMFQNGKWTPKQLSNDSLRHKAKLIQVWDPKTTDDANHNNWKKLETYPVPLQTGYQMCPRMVSDAELDIDIVYRDDKYDAVGGETAASSVHVGSFVFANGGIARKIDGAGGASVDTITDFQFVRDKEFLTMYSYQAGDLISTPPFFSQVPKVQYDSQPGAGSKSNIYITDTTHYVFNHTFIDPLLKHINVSNTTQSINNLYTQFGTLSDQANTALDDPFGLTPSNSFNEQLSPYALYNWELGLHAPMTIIDGLLNAQQFDDALEVCHTIFDPNTVATAGNNTDNSKYWKFLPFKSLANTDAKESLSQMFLQLSPQTPDSAINEWRENPFSPHLVARSRPVAYMKWIAMKYIEILIAYGDYYFRQNSLETIPNAIQCYVIASHVYGPRGQKIPPRGKKTPQTYASLLNKWDAFGNAIVQMEVEFPFSNQTLLPIGSSNGVSGFGNVFGFATALYFCIPDNPQLRDLRDTIDDRLYKIRNCMDINGVVRHLALWDPPIDPALLVQATAQGLSLDTVLNDLSGPIPNYRFQILISKALEMCAELRQLGAGFLSAREKRDGETLSVLRASHETVMNNLILDIRTRQLDEANKSLDQLLYSREAPSYRLQFYQFLVGNTDGAPGETDDFNQLPNPSLQAPQTEGELLLNTAEQEEVQKALAAQNWALGIGSVEALAAIFHAIPSSEAAAKPWGVGAGLVWGGVNMGHTTSALARGLQVYETYLSRSSANAGRKAALLRQMQDRIFQANLAGLELKNIDKQIAAHRVRISTMEQEVKNQETQLEQVTAVEDFLRTKYTNAELYGWIEGTTKSLYQQSYNLAFDLAKRAEKAFNFERPQNTTEFIRMGYWNNARDGLLAGEQLLLGLKRLESAYQESLGHDFELTKHVSVRQWAPLALIDFRETGEFEITLPEILFDMDCPGQYMRRISSVAITIPCVVGPYTSVNCTVRLLSHTIRTTPRASGKADYPQSTDGDDGRFSVLNVPISWVALSSAQNDNGRHELTLSDRYNPFEGAGAISSWRFSLPADFRAFDYGTITDVVMHIRYTSLDGGDKLRSIASASVLDYVKVMERTSTDGGGLGMFFDIRADFASEWFASTQVAGSTGSPREIKLNNLSDRLPQFTRMTAPKRILATSLVLLGQGIAAEEVEVQLQGADDVAVFKPGVDIGDLTGVVSEGVQMSMTSWVLRLKGSSVGVEKLWMVVKYALT